MDVIIHHAGQTASATLTTFQAVLDQLVKDTGERWNPPASRIEMREPAPAPPAPPAVPAIRPAEILADVDVQPGEVMPEAATRIQGEQDRAIAAGFEGVGRAHQFFDTGTKMLAEGHDAMREREREHAQLQDARTAIAAFSARIDAEKRTGIILSAGEIARALAINGKLTVKGYTLREQAMRGLLARIGSKATGYTLAVRDRIAANLQAKNDNGQTLRPAEILSDKAHLLATLVRECEANPDVQLQLRARDGLGDIFACVSPSYGEADAPDVLRESVLGVLPDGCKASVHYDEARAAWQVQAAVWTPTPNEEMAVGEPFRCALSVRSHDGGGGSLTIGALMELIRCLNASIYEAEAGTTRRVHRANVLLNLADAVKDARQSFDTFVKGWQVAREETIVLPTVENGGLIPLETAIPGFFRAMLTRRKGELLGVLKGRTETHVQALAARYDEERRDPAKVVRADLAQAYTRHVRDLPDVGDRLAAQAAIGSWLVNREPVTFAAK